MNDIVTYDGDGWKTTFNTDPKSPFISYTEPPDHVKWLQKVTGSGRYCQAWVNRRSRRAHFQAKKSGEEQIVIYGVEMFQNVVQLNPRWAKHAYYYKTSYGRYAAKYLKELKEQQPTATITITPEKS